MRRIGKTVVRVFFPAPRWKSISPAESLQRRVSRLVAQGDVAQVTHEVRAGLASGVFSSKAFASALFLCEGSNSAVAGLDLVRDARASGLVREWTDESLLAVILRLQCAAGDADAATQMFSYMSNAGLLRLRSASAFLSLCCARGDRRIALAAKAEAQRHGLELRAADYAALGRLFVELREPPAALHAMLREMQEHIASIPRAMLEDVLAPWAAAAGLRAVPFRLGPESTESTGSTESTKGSESTGSTKGSESTGGTKGSESTGSTKGSESTGSTKGSESTESTKGSESTGSTKGLESTGGTKGSESTGSTKGSESTGGTKGSESTGSTKGSESTESTKGSESTGSTKGSESTGSTKGSESTGGTKGSESTGSTKGSESTGSTKGSESTGAAQCCPHCGARLRGHRFTAAQRERLLRDVAAAAAESRAGPGAFASWQRFVEAHGARIDVLIDGANLGYYGLSSWYADAKRALLLRRGRRAESIRAEELTWSARRAVDVGVSFELIDAAVAEARRRGLRPLVLLHARHCEPRNISTAAAELIAAQWRRDGALYCTPRGLNDDLCWLHAALKLTTPTDAQIDVAKARTVWVLTNDLMRDHHFRLLSPRCFAQWRDRHRIAFRCSREDGKTLLHWETPPPFARCIQELEPQRWHIPIDDECTDTAAETEETERLVEEQEGEETSIREEEGRQNAKEEVDGKVGEASFHQNRNWICLR